MEGRPPLRKKGGFIQRNRGAAMGSCLLFILIILVIFYLGFKFGKAYWTYFAVKTKTHEALVWAAAGTPKLEGEIQQKVIQRAQEADLELSPRNVKVTQAYGSLTISVFWVYDVVLPGHTFPMEFKIIESEAKRWH